MTGINPGDTAWLLTATALVLVMTPGVGLFYAGMVRKTNAVSVLAMSFVALSLACLHWALLGYTLSFGPDIGGLIGGLKWAGLKGVHGAASEFAPTVPHMAFVAFQFSFAAITAAIVISPFAERGRMTGFMLYVLLWLTLIYAPLAHWVWGGGWLSKLGALDFAGGTVVHINSGFSALAVALVIGKRRGFGEFEMEPHNIPLALIGAALLWFGWLGFNGGSALRADQTAASAFLVTNIAASAGALGWMLENWRLGKPSALGLVSGAVAGLVAITPAAGFVGPMEAIVIGAAAGFLCYHALLFRTRIGLDESLDAWAIHGIGGLWGAIATGIFARKEFGGVSGLIEGNIAQFGVQVLGAAAACVYAFVLSYVIAKVVQALVGLRVTEEEEYVGLDISQHGEAAYS